MPPIRLIVHLRHTLAGRSHDTARVEHHTRDWIVVGVGVVDGAGSEVPDLESCQRRVLVDEAFVLPWGCFPLRGMFRATGRREEG